MIGRPRRPLGGVRVATSFLYIRSYHGRWVTPPPPNSILLGLASPDFPICPAQEKCDTIRCTLLGLASPASQLAGRLRIPSRRIPPPAPAPATRPRPRPRPAAARDRAESLVFLRVLVDSWQKG